MQNFIQFLYISKKGSHMDAIKKFAFIKKPWKKPAKWQICSTAWQNLRSHPPRWKPHDVTAYPRPLTAGRWPLTPSPTQHNSTLTIDLQIPPRQDRPRNFLQVTQLRFDVTNFVNYRTKWISKVEHPIIEHNSNQLNSGYVDSPIHVSWTSISPSSFHFHITLFSTLFSFYILNNTFRSF